MTKSLDGKFVIVTGSDSGIGRATAVEFAKEGADVAVVCFQDRDGAEETCQQGESQGRRAVVVRLDQRELEQIAQVFEEVERGLGTPFVLVNGAGRDATGKQVADMSNRGLGQHDPHQPLRSVLLQPTLYPRAQGCQRQRQDHQHHLRASGDSARRRGRIRRLEGLRNLTHTLALGLAPDRINVSNIAPMMVLTPMSQPAIDDPALLEKQVQSIPFKRAAKPREIARLAVYLASGGNGLRDRPNLYT